MAVKKNTRVIIFLLLIFFIQGCHNQEIVIWNFGNTCKLPCWNGVVVGKTTKGEFSQILNKLPIIDQEKIFLDGEPWKFFSETSYFSFNDVDIHCVAYYLGKNIVNLTFSGELRTTFGEMVDLVGEPDYILTVLTVLPTVGYSVTAIYPTLGIEYSYNTRDLSKQASREIRSDIPIDFLSFFDPEIYNDFIDASLFGQGSLSGEETRESMRPWDGYGPLLEKYPPAQID